MTDTLSFACKQSAEYAVGQTVLGLLVLGVVVFLAWMAGAGIHATFVKDWNR